MNFWNTKAGAYLVLGLLAVAVVWFVFYHTKDAAIKAAKDAANAVNPGNQNNSIYLGASDVINAARDVSAGNPIGTSTADGNTLGSLIADWFPSSAEQQFQKQQHQ